MKHFLLLLLLVPSLLIAQSKSQANSKNGYTITGNLKGYEDGAIIDLLNGNTGQPEASTTLKDGKFSFTGKMEFPDYRLISINKTAPYISFFLENSDVTVNAGKESLESAVITGSKSHDDFVAYNKIFKQYEVFFLQNPPIDSVKMKEGALAFENFTVQNSNSYVSPIAIYRHFQLMGDGDKMEDLFSKLNKDIRTTPVGGFIQQQIAESKKNPLGKVLPDFSQADSSGKQLKLSSLRGKYVLVDFWASWCGPCRQENPNLVASYNRFKDKNFTVLGVSLDKTRKPWIDAIHKDKLTWYHVSDLGGWQNAVSQQFGISSIPQNFLLDPNGVVIAKNLRGSALDAKLASIFEK